MSKIIVSAQTVTMEQIATQDVSDDLGVFTGATPNFKAQVNLELGLTATTTTWDEKAKALLFASANRDHDIGFIFVSGTATNFTMGEFVNGSPLNGCTLTWSTDDTVGARGGEIFVNPANCDIFRLFASSFSDLATDGSGHDVELPAHVATANALSVALVAGGTGYAVNDVLTGVSGTGTKATATVTAVSGGVITALSPTTEGSYTVNPNAIDTTTVSPAGGSGATVAWGMVYVKSALGGTFNNMGEIDIGDCTFEGNTIVAASSGVLYSGTGTRRAKNNTYIGCADALHFDTAQTVSVNGDQFQGNDFDVHFSGTGTLTINANGSNISTSRVSGGGTVVINNAIVLTFTGYAIGTEIRVYLSSSGAEVDGIETTTAATWDATLDAATAYDIVAIYPGYVPIRRENQSFAASQNFNLNQQVDRNFEND